MVVIYTSTPSIDSDATVAEEIKKSLPDVFLVMVGTHVSATSDETLKTYTWVDGIARREYDETLLDIAHLLSQTPRPDVDNLKKIKGLSFRLNGKISHNSDRAFITDMDQFPLVSEVYKKLLKVENYFYSITQYPEITIVTGRGCPHHR